MRGSPLGGDADILLHVTCILLIMTFPIVQMVSCQGPLKIRGPRQLPALCVCVCVIVCVCESEECVCVRLRVKCARLRVKCACVRVCSDLSVDCVQDSGRQSGEW